MMIRKLGMEYALKMRISLFNRLEQGVAIW